MDAPLVSPVPDLRPGADTSVQQSIRGCSPPYGIISEAEQRRRKNFPVFGTISPRFSRRSTRAVCIRVGTKTLWCGESKTLLKQASNRVTDKRAAYQRRRSFLCPYPRTESRETAQWRALEGKQTPNEPPGPLCGTVFTGRGHQSDPRPLSCSFFDRWVQRKNIHQLYTG